MAYVPFHIQKAKAQKEREDLINHSAAAGAINFADFVIERMRADDAKRKKKRHQTAIETVLAAQNKFMLEAEIRGYQFAPQKKSFIKRVINKIKGI